MSRLLKHIQTLKPNTHAGLGVKPLAYTTAPKQRWGGFQELYYGICVTILCCLMGYIYWGSQKKAEVYLESHPTEPPTITIPPIELTWESADLSPQKGNFMKSAAVAKESHSAAEAIPAGKNTVAIPPASSVTPGEQVVPNSTKNQRKDSVLATNTAVDYFPTGEPVTALAKKPPSNQIEDAPLAPPFGALKSCAKKIAQHLNATQTAQKHSLAQLNAQAISHLFSRDQAYRNKSIKCSAKIDELNERELQHLHEVYRFLQAFHIECIRIDGSASRILANGCAYTKNTWISQHPRLKLVNITPKELIFNDEYEQEYRKEITAND